MHFSSILLALPLTLATPTPADTAKRTAPSISVDVFDDAACAIPTVRGYIFTANNACQQFIRQEGSVTATSLGGAPVQPGCVLRIFASTNCRFPLKDVEVDGSCTAPGEGGLASSGMLVGC